LARRKESTHLYELAKRGAEVRLRDLVQEAKYLIELFPHLRDSFDKDELPINFIVAKDSGSLTKKTGGKRMSAAARAKISAAQKRRWAKVKAKAQE
jgi:hypothetical protein